MPLGLARQASELGQSDKPKPPAGPPALPLMDAPEKPPVQVALDDLEGFDASMPPPVIPPPVPSTSGNGPPSLPAMDDAPELRPPLPRQESLDFILDAPAVVPPPVNLPPMPTGEESTTVNPPPSLPADVPPKPKKPHLRKVTGSWGEPLPPANAEITAVGATLSPDVAASRRSSASASPGSSATSSRRSSRSPSRRNSCSLRDMLEPKAPAWERRQKLQRKGSRSSTPIRMWSPDAPEETNMFAAAERKAEASAMEAALTGMGMDNEQENQLKEVTQTERVSRKGSHSAKVAPAELTLERCTSEVPLADPEPEAAPQAVPRHTLDALGPHSSSKHPAIGNVSGGSTAAEVPRVWQRIESTREHEPDALERLRTECTNYAVVTALLAGSATEAFMNPPEFEEEWQKNAFGVTCGISVMLLLMNVILSTIIIIHTNLCCKRTQTDFYLAIVDDLTYPNTICFYMAVWLTPVWMCLAAIPNYGYGVALPVCGAGLLLFIFLFYVFMKHATKINAMTISAGVVTPRLSSAGKWESPVVTPRLSVAGKYQS